MKVEFAQLAGRDNDTAYNLERALAAIAACADDTQLIVFPETHLTGFPTSETVAAIAEPLDGPTVQAIIQAARARDVAVVIGIAENDDGQFYNATLLITSEGIALKYRKTHLWPLERGVFNPGDRYPTCMWNGLRVGLLICYDIEFPENARRLALGGAELIVVPTANMQPYDFTCQVTVRSRAQENQCFLVYANYCGAEDEIYYCGQSSIIGPDGSVLAMAGQEECQLVADLDHERVVQGRKAFPYLTDLRCELHLRNT